MAALVAGKPPRHRKWVLQFTLLPSSYESTVESKKDGKDDHPQQQEKNQQEKKPPQFFITCEPRLLELATGGMILNQIIKETGNRPKWIASLAVEPGGKSPPHLDVTGRINIQCLSSRSGKHVWSRDVFYDLSSLTMEPQQQVLPEVLFFSWDYAVAALISIVPRPVGENGHALARLELGLAPRSPPIRSPRT